MKTILFTFSIFILLVLQINKMQAQNVDEIISKHIEAHGGIVSWSEVETLKSTGIFTGFSIPKPFVTIQKIPNLYRSDFGVGKFDVILAYDGSKGWTLDPWFEVPFARNLNKSESNVVLQKAEICSPFLNYKQKGYTVEFIEKTQVDGMGMFKLKLTRQNNQNEFWYINADTYLEYKQESNWDDFGFATSQETFFDDFRNVDNLILPFYIERSYGIRSRIIEIENIEINTKVKDNYFDFPVSEEMQKLADLKGNWAVVVKAPSAKGWYVTDSVSTSIKQNKNMLQTNFTYDNYFRVTKTFSWTYNTEIELYQLIVHNDFSSNTQVLQGDFVNDTLLCSNSNIGFNNDEPKVYRKVDLIRINDNHFILDQCKSQDKGTTWRVDEKMFLTRIN